MGTACLRNSVRDRGTAFHATNLVVGSCTTIGYVSRGSPTEPMTTVASEISSATQSGDYTDLTHGQEKETVQPAAVRSVFDSGSLTRKPRSLPHSVLLKNEVDMASANLRGLTSASASAESQGDVKHIQ